MWFKSIIDYLGSAVRSNTGVSSLSLVTVSLGVMSIIILLVICACMLIEVITSKTIITSLEGYAEMITAVAGLMASVGIPKAINNYGENKYGNKDDEDNTIIDN